jgi:hypothetical protein
MRLEVNAFDFFWRVGLDPPESRHKQALAGRERDLVNCHQLDEWECLNHHCFLSVKQIDRRDSFAGAISGLGIKGLLEGG